MSKRIIIIVIIVIVFIISIFCAVIIPNKLNYNRSDKLSGLWNIDSNTKYKFDGKGKGKLIVPLFELEFSYKLNKGILLIDFDNENYKDAEYLYKVSDNELEITDINDSSLQFKLKKIEEL